MRLKILFHDNCFDGAASAALFSAFYLEKVDPAAQVTFLGMHHRPGDAFSADSFDGDVNVCVDFRYSPSPRLDWWFDHHVSGFQSAADRAQFDANPSKTKFYDPKARSCTKYEAGILASQFGWDASRFKDLIDWADVIDGAQFPNARFAVELEAPALRVMTWIEHNKDAAATLRLIGDMQSKSLDEIVQQPYIAEPLKPLFERHQAAIKLIGERAREVNGVVFFDLLDDNIEAHNKFITYMLFPECRYTVGLTKSAARVKISVGSNPWSTVPRQHDIAKICERYGGGGHPVVGAISIPVGETEKARAVAADIVRELQG